MTNTAKLEPQLRTMTVDEVTQKLKSLGVKTSQVKVREAIKQGQYPFAIHVKMTNDEFEIYAKLFDKWLAERID